MQTHLLVLFALAACLLLKELQLVCSVPLSGKRSTVEEEENLQQQNETAAAVAAANCTASNSSSSSSRSRNRTVARTEQEVREQKQMIFKSIREHILMKLGLSEPPNVSRHDVVPPSLVAEYRAMNALERNADEPQECLGRGETTHFSRQVKHFQPNSFVSVDSLPDHFQQSGSNEGEHEIKESSKEQKKASANSKSEPTIAPVLYTLRFDDLAEQLSRGDRVWLGQLQLYKRKASNVDIKRGINPVETVKVYRVVRRSSKGRETKTYILLESKNVGSEEDGYVSFDVKDCVKEWLRENDNLRSLEFEVAIETPEIVDSGLFFPPAIIFDVPSANKGEKNAHLRVEILNRREPSRDHDALFHRRKRQTVEGVSNQFCSENPNTESCCLRELTVDIREDLGLDFVVLPRNYTPNYCSGGCTAGPNLSAATNSTKYLIQLRESNPTAAPEPCCIAHRTRPLTVFVELNGMLISREIPDMITESCICR